MDAKMAAQSKQSNFQYDMCMCADSDEPNQTTAAFSKLHGLCCKAGFKLRFMQHKIASFSSLLSGCNYNTIEQKQPIHQWVTEQPEPPLTHTETSAAIITALHNLIWQDE